MILIKKINKNTFRINIRRILLIVLMGIFIHFIIFYSGGTKTAWAPLNIFPIVIAAYYWQVKGSVLVAIFLGIGTGPFIPLSVTDGIQQEFDNWIIRILIYVLVAYLVGNLVKRDIELNEKIRKKELTNSVTGLYNINKLLPKLEEMINNQEKFHLIVLKIKNLEGISKYVNYRIVKRISYVFTKKVKNCFNGVTIYSFNYDEYAFVLKKYSEYEVKEKLYKIIQNDFSLIKIENYTFRLQIKGGIKHSCTNEIDALDLFNKARVALDQGGALESGVYSYDAKLEYDERILYEIAGSMIDALENNEFYLVYQPIIDINEYTVSGAEVLLRWNRGDRESVGPNVFIDIAEKIGLIKRISKWVIEKNINQMIEWKNKGIEIKTSINLTVQEMIDDSFIEWIIRTIDENGIHKSNFGIEITERVFSMDEKKLNDVLLNLRNQGYAISIDDFGTGYNSLKTVGQIPSDIIKIDKYFIERIDKIEIKMLDKQIIDGFHEIGKVVVAEGVETKEQVEVLKKFGCDKIQGYYFSKPLLPENFAEYYLNFNKL